MEGLSPIVRRFFRFAFFSRFSIIPSGGETMTRRAKITSVLLTLIMAFPILSFSLKDIMSSPFPSDLIIAPTKDRIAWVFNNRGRRNIWIAEAPNFKAIRLTNYKEDDGQEIGQLSFTPDGEIIIYVRGDAPNRQGEYPNPTSNPAGVQRTILAVKVKDGKSWKIGEGTEPSISPDGNIVVFRKGNQVLFAPVDGSKSPEILFKARGRNRYFTWSPDGKKLAFVSYRGDHSFIGIYDIVKKKISWLLPDVDRDSHPVWSPDGRQIAFIRLPGAKMKRRPIWNAWDVPFSIWVVDVETGKGKKVYEAEKGGGFAEYYPRNSLLWAADHHLIFYSEEDGWMHLYSTDLKSGKTICLTPGKYEVENLALTPDRETIIFNTNKEDIDRRHLWEVSIYGGEPKQLTKGNGIEWSPKVLPSGKYIALICSTAVQPAAPAIIPAKGGKPKLIAPELIPSSFPTKELVKPKQVIFKSADGLQIHGQLFVPKSVKKGDSLPALIFMHGGPIRQMLLGWHYFYYYHNSYAFNQFMASRGYVVLSVNYRSGIGYGAAFRTAPNQGPAGASEYQDIIAAAKFLQKLPYVDPLKIGLWGGSYGGYLTALGLARDSDLFAAGVDMHGVHDWSWRGMMRGVEDWGIDKERMRIAYESSPVASVYTWTSPVLFIHGDDDRNVDFIQTTDLVQKLRELKRVHVETLIFPDEVHDFLLWKHWIQAYKTSADFFDRFLKNKR